MRSVRISIHAPLRERHQQDSPANMYRQISIHAPLRERPAEPRERAEAEHFNPRSLTGATVEQDHTN